MAKSAGFCYGVQRAVDLAQKTAEETDHVWMLGDLIHNTHVVDDLSRRGIRKTEEPSALKAGDTVASLPRKAKSSTPMPWISLQTRTQLPQRMHLLGSRTMEGELMSRGCSSL